MAEHTRMRQLGQQDIDAVAEYIRQHATIMTSAKSNKQFIGLDGFDHEVAGLKGTLRFSFFGLNEVAEGRQRLTQRVARDVAKLTEDEKAALLEELTR